MKKILSISILFLMYFIFVGCKNQEQDQDEVNIEINKIENAQNTQTEFKNSVLRNGGKIEIGVIYTDTVQFIEFNDNYDDLLFIVSKGTDTIPLIYNDDEPKFMLGEQLVIKWKIDSLRPAGDPEYLTYADYLVAAKRINENFAFSPEFYKLPLKKLPVVDSTSFDSFDDSDYKKIDVKSFQLPIIYKNWYNETYNFKVISGYRLDFSTNFYSAVLTVKKGDNEMETTLINYDLEGNLIDYKLIAYDEIAEGFFKTVSTINRDEIAIKNIEWTDEGHETTDIFKLTSEGKFSIMTNEEVVINKAITQLKLKREKLKQNLITHKYLKRYNETILVLPEIVEEEEGYFSLNTHIGVYNHLTNSITHRYFESSKTNNWVSDAVRLDKIEIDTAPYLIDVTTRAFGVRVHYFGSSRVNPYYNQTLSLFVKENDVLKNILHNYSVEENTGEWNGSCEGEFHDEKKELIASDNKTNGYFDFIIKNTITKTTNFETEIGDCDYNEEIKRETSVLKFDGNQYK